MSAPRQSERPPRTYVVLCVDDHANGLTIRRALLESFGYAVHTATSGAEAMEIAGHTPLDVVVLDYRMPDMDGLTLAQKIKSRLPRLPLIVLSGYTSELPGELRSLAAVCLRKGSHPTALRQALERVLGRPARDEGRGGETRTLDARTRENLHRAKELVKISRKRVARTVQSLSYKRKDRSA